MHIQNVITAASLKLPEIRYLLDAAKSFRKPYHDGTAPKLLAGKTIVNMFFENSTRTRSSFELATRALGGSTLNFSSSGSSVQKGETLIDTAKNVVAMNPHCLVVRHASAGSPFVLARVLKLPIVNAGDGFHEHPTQGLLDALTIEDKLGTVKGKHVLILGDIAHSRVARSNIHILRKMGAKVSVCGPPTLLPPVSKTLGVTTYLRPEKALATADVVMALRIQLERQNKMQLPSVVEYTQNWGLNAERAALMKPGSIILHPGPVNRGVELSPEVADGPKSVILDQVTNGVLVRMAVLAATCNAKGLKDWLK